MALPVTEFARSGDVNIACEVVGGGSLDLAAAPDIRDGQLTVPGRSGWGADGSESVLRAHPWSRP